MIDFCDLTQAFSSGYQHYSVRRAAPAAYGAPNYSQVRFHPPVAHRPNIANATQDATCQGGPEVREMLVHETLLLLM